MAKITRTISKSEADNARRVLSAYTYQKTKEGAKKAGVATKKYAKQAGQATSRTAKNVGAKIAKFLTSK